MAAVSPWDYDASDTPATARPVRKPKTDDENAAYGGNTDIYSPPAAPKTPWDRGGGQPAATATPAKATAPQGSRAAPPAAPSLAISPVGSPYSMPKTSSRAFVMGTPKVPTTIPKDPVTQGVVGAVKQIGKDTGPGGSMPVTTGPNFTGPAGAVGAAATTAGVPSFIYDTAQNPFDVKGAVDAATAGADKMAKAAVAGAQQPATVAKKAADYLGGSDSGSDITSAVNKAAVSSGAVNGGGGGGQAVGGMPGIPDILKGIGTGIGDLPKTLGDNLGQLGAAPGGVLSGINWDEIPGYNGVVGGMNTINDVLSNPGAWFESLGGKLTDAMGFNNEEAQGYMDQVLDSAGEQYDSTGAINAGLDRSDAALYSGTQGAVGGYKTARDQVLDPYLGRLSSMTAGAENDYGRIGSQIDALTNRTQGEQSQTRERLNHVYNQMDSTNDQLGNVAAKSGQYNGSWVDWNDPNNQIATANRNLYNQQAQGTRRAGLADAGVLSALGAQANAGAFAGRPMTGGQMQAAAGASQNRAGQAFAMAQQRAQDLQDQGLARGYEQTQAAYGRNQDALNRSRQAQLDLNSQIGSDYGMRQQMQDQTSQQMQSDLGMRQGMRGEMEGLYGQTADIGTNRANENYGLDSDLLGLQHDLSGASGARNLANSNQFYGTQQTALGGKASLADAMRTGKMGFWKDLLTHGIDAIPESMKGLGAMMQGATNAVPF